MKYVCTPDTMSTNRENCCILVRHTTHTFFGNCSLASSWMVGKHLAMLEAVRGSSMLLLLPDGAVDVSSTRAHKRHK